MQICAACGGEFAKYLIVDGTDLNLRGRKHCLDCRPHRPLRRPRKPVSRPSKTKVCEACGNRFAAKAVINGKMRALYRRRFCLNCSPFGMHNTSTTPVAIVEPTELKEHRRRKRNAKAYRCQKRRRRRRKAELVIQAGGRCIDCGYAVCLAALEFHHRDASTKDFGVGSFDGSLERLLPEVAKCDLLCASCHRLRHARLDGDVISQAHGLERDRKARAVDLMGGVCYGCDRDGPCRLFEFHHVDASGKDFGISQSGIHSRPWEKIVAELEKCLMLCANCHREVHAGLREIAPKLPGLAEDAMPYVA